MKITDKCAVQGDETIFICDYSPLKSSTAETYAPAQDIDADYICVAYLPGKAVRVNSTFLAYAIKQHTGRDVIFNIATRDMNKLAIESLLLGAQLIGLDNVLVLMGDKFTEKQLQQVKDVSDFTPTGLIKAINLMNEGIDYKGLKLKAPTDLCVGATIDLTRGVEHEARLAFRKVQAGAQYLLSQPVFSPAEVTQFEAAYRQIAGEALDLPVFWGVQVFVKGGVVFSNVPDSIRQDLDKGRDGAEIALQQLEEFRSAGLKRIYLVPPILKGGARDYPAAQKVLKAAKNNSKRSDT